MTTTKDLFHCISL